ncbi:unnamed protein product, partial [Didymodactylos carnosus]
MSNVFYFSISTYYLIFFNFCTFIQYSLLISNYKFSSSTTLQRFLFDEQTQTIIVASNDRLYKLHSSNLSILTEIDTSSTSSTTELCTTIITRGNITTSYINTNPLNYLSINSYLFNNQTTINSTYNQLLLLTPSNDLLVCSTSNRGLCQIRSLSNLTIIENSSSRIVSTNIHYSSFSFIGNDSILYTAVTYDSSCDSLYEIPALSGRSLSKQSSTFLKIFNHFSNDLHSSSYSLRFVNNRIAREFPVHYLYGFDHRLFTYFLTIQELDIQQQQQHYYNHYSRTSSSQNGGKKLLTKLIRFCQKAQQAPIKSYVELPITCKSASSIYYPYLISAYLVKDDDNSRLYGVFRNTTTSSTTNTSHAVCVFSMKLIRENIFQTIKNCVVDGNGQRGLSFISPDTHCLPNK